MKKIIVPIDFSEHSEYALEAAAIIAQKHDAELLALHMLEISDAILTHNTGEQQSKAFFLLKLAEKRFDQFLEKDYLNGIKITPIVKHFKVFSEVNDVAKEQNADLIVMGSHGASGVKEFFVGSNTEK
ncbi:MAG: universal stress protein, partial [Bacteroidia bacterium]|nr:universal stress protein [Bacteroidia bacterium]